LLLLLLRQVRVVLDRVDGGLVPGVLGVDGVAVPRLLGFQAFLALLVVLVRGGRSRRRRLLGGARSGRMLDGVAGKREVRYVSKRMRRLPEAADARQRHENGERDRAGESEPEARSAAALRAD